MTVYDVKINVRSNINLSHVLIRFHYKGVSGIAIFHSPARRHQLGSRYCVCVFYPSVPPICSIFISVIVSVFVCLFQPNGLGGHQSGVGTLCGGLFSSCPRHAQANRPAHAPRTA